jgi:hypothetical protein
VVPESCFIIVAIACLPVLKSGTGKRDSIRTG